MSLRINIGGRNYVPLRALPHLTSGILNSKTVQHAIADPDAYCDVQSDIVMQPLLLDPGNKLVLINHALFKHQRPGLPQRVLIEEVRARTFFEMLVERLVEANVRSVKPHQTVWLANPTLTSAQEATVMQGLPNPRKNSVLTLRSHIQAALTSITKTLASHGIHLDHRAMPATRLEWCAILRELNPQLSRSPSTINDHFKAMGIKWLPGSRGAQIAPIRKALGMSPKSQGG